MKWCLLCNSKDIEDVRKAIMKENENVVDSSIKITVGTPFKAQDRDYDMYECRSCGFLMFFRRKRED
jgi:hypothetical protein